MGLKYGSGAPTASDRRAAPGTADLVAGTRVLIVGALGRRSASHPEETKMRIAPLFTSALLVLVLPARQGGDRPPSDQPDRGPPRRSTTRCTTATISGPTATHAPRSPSARAPSASRRRARLDSSRSTTGPSKCVSRKGR